MTIVRLDSGMYDVGDRKVPGVTTVLKVLGGYRPGGEYYMERGREVHDVIAHLLAGDTIMSMDPDVAPFVQAWMRFRDEMGFEADIVERPVYSERYGYAGTLDATGVMSLSAQRHLGVFDWKTCTTFAITKAMGPQLAAYLKALPNGCPHRQRFIVLLREDGQYRVKSMKDPRDWPIYQSCLNVWRYLNG